MAKSASAVPKTISALSARSQFGQIMRRASGNKRERFVVDRRGQPTVVIMGIDDFLATVAPEPEVLAKIRAASRKNGTSALSMAAIDREIASHRREKARSNGKARSRP
jgi:hypothetical protein